MLALATLVWLMGWIPAQNSKRKIRAQPSAMAARAGSAVVWREDLSAALAESAKTGKPVFWYVTTVAGSPMDRKPEIDRYMMSGPFSWPRTIVLLNTGFIPVRGVARGAEAKKYQLLRGKFIEPGYVVLDGKGEELARKDQLTTFHQQWFCRPLENLVTVKLPLSQPSPALSAYMEGVALFHAGESGKAIAHWQKIAAKYPDDPMAFKSAAEAEGHGPFRFGFEVYGALPELALANAAKVPGSRAPDGVYDEVSARRRSLDFLCRMQLDNGGWEDSRYDFGGTDSLPNVYTACTALIAEALLEELQAEQPLLETKRLEQSLARAIAYLRDDRHINLEDRDELIWAHVYRIYFFARYLELRGGKKESAISRQDLSALVQKVFDMQPGNGAWFHEYANPFVIAEVLLALHQAEKAGVVLDQPKVARGLRALVQCRTKVGAYSYGYSRRQPRGSIEAAAGRMPLCELALLVHGQSDQQKLDAALVAALKHHDLMRSVRKYDDHANRHGYGGFFFWFDMLGRTRAMQTLTDDARRRALLASQHKLVMSLTEFDGCFVDSHELGRTYGTAMALLCLAHLRR